MHIHPKLNYHGIYQILVSN